MSMTRKSSITLIPGVLTAIVAIFGAISLTQASSAQDAQQAAAIVEKLPQPSKDVIARLSELRNLPEGQWNIDDCNLMIGDMGCIYISIDEHQQLRWSESCF